MVENVSICRYCSKPIRAGRSDKKYCNQGCKDAYTNQIKKQEREEISRVEGILKRNRRTLKKLFQPDKPEVLVSRESIVKEGFEFDYHTHHLVTKTKGNEFLFCYDYGYREVEKDKYKIIRQFE
jgi:hypothetical protein